MKGGNYIMEGINHISEPGRRGVEAVLAQQNRETATKRAPEGPDKMERGDQVKIELVAQAMDNYVSSIQRNLKIQVHDSTGKIMVKVISKEDGHVVREIPPEEMLNLAAKMEAMMGALFNENA